MILYHCTVLTEGQTLLPKPVVVLRDALSPLTRSLRVRQGMGNIMASLDLDPVP